MIVVTADHGESLFDDGFLGHGHMLNEQQTRIPFILSDPGVAMPAVIGLADMRAIILRAAGARAPRAAARRSSNISAASIGPARSALVDAGRPPDDLQPVRAKRSGPAHAAAGRRYADLGGRAERAADALIDEWARQRWLRIATER